MALANCIFDSPAILAQPCPQGTIRNCCAALFKNLSNRKPLSVIKEMPIGSFVVCLGLSGSPLAILRVVTTEIFNSFQRIFWRRSWSHVFIKSRKAVTPAPTNCDSTTAVLRKASNCFVVTAVFHRGPNLIFWNMTHSVGRASDRGCFGSQTSARFCISASKIIDQNSTLTTAIAPTKCSFLRKPLFDYQETKPVINLCHTLSMAQR